MPIIPTHHLLHLVKLFQEGIYFLNCSAGSGKWSLLRRDPSMSSNVLTFFLSSNWWWPSCFFYFIFSNSEITDLAKSSTHTRYHLENQMTSNDWWPPICRNHWRSYLFSRFAIMPMASSCWLLLPLFQREKEHHPYRVCNSKAIRMEWIEVLHLFADWNKLIGTPVTYPIERAAPPRASGIHLGKQHLVRPILREVLATLTASWPVIASATIIRTSGLSSDLRTSTKAGPGEFFINL